jgi:hypothetical protein
LFGWDPAVNHDLIVDDQAGGGNDTICHNFPVIRNFFKCGILSELLEFNLGYLLLVYNSRTRDPVL